MRDSPSRRQCACAVAGSLHLCFPSHCRPEGAPGQAGPCSPAPVPVGFVSIRRRHPGCTLHAALRTSLRRLEAAGALGVAGRLGADPPPALLPVGGSGHRPHLRLWGRTGTESRRQPCPLHLSAPGAMLRCSRDCCGSTGSEGQAACPGVLARPLALSCACTRPKEEAPLVEAMWEACPLPSHLAPFIWAPTGSPSHASSNLWFHS